MCAVRIEEITGYERFNDFVNKLPENGPKVMFYFTGKKDAQGHTEPVVRHFLSELKKDVIFVFVDVGDRPYWKDQSCPFRTDPRLKIAGLPTILVWKGVQRLMGSQCGKVELLQMLFEDEDH